ncbi:MAG: hypothetical protein WC179_08585 [Candidatus Cloacimonadaceae bacterium]
MRKISLLFLLLIPLLLAGQSLNDEGIVDEETSAESSITSSPNFGFGGTLGNVLIDGDYYTQFRLQPEIVIWKFGLGLDIDLLIDSNGNIRKEDWDSWDDALNKLYYFRFAQRQDPFYFKVGSITDYTMGHGLIFDEYSNMLHYPNVKPIGGYVGMNIKSLGAGFEIFTHNVSKNEILGGHLYVQPLKPIGIPLLKNLKVGASIGMDRNPFGKYEDSDEDGYPDVYDKFPDNPSYWLDTDNDGIPDNIDIDLNGNSILDHPSQNPYVQNVFPGIADNYPNYPFDTEVYPDEAMPMSEGNEIRIYGLDYELPILDKKGFGLSHYAEYAMIEDYGSGLIFPGFAARFLIFNLNLEFRNFKDQFLPGFFNHLYDEQRSQVVYTTIESENGRRCYSLKTKESELAGVTSSLGWFGSLKANLGNFAYLRVTYQDMYNDSKTKGKSLWGELTVIPNIIPKLQEASIVYGQSNVDYISFDTLRNENAEIGGKIVYNLSSAFNLALRYSEYYRDLNRDGKIKGNDEIIESMSLGVEFQF